MKILLTTGLLILFSVCPGHAHAFDETADRVGFEKLTLTEEFQSEGIAIADVDGDGNNDVLSGPFWYAGPDFRNRFRYADYQPDNPASPADRALSIKGYSQHFFTWACDFNKDGRQDILAVGMPGDAAYWFENPGKNLRTDQNWVKRKAYEDISNESPAFLDITGDGQPEIICIHQGGYVYIQHVLDQGQVSFKHTPITPKLGYGRFTHGQGLGDINGDGKLDLLETKGWWEQRAAGELFVFHPFRFAESGGAQMFAYDFDGDGDNDVICSQNAHGYGLKWFEQVRADNKIDFVARTIMTDQSRDNSHGLAISQMHAAALVDIDGDGVRDLVTGKRYWAHGGGDPGSKQLPLLFWLKTVRDNGRVHFKPQLVDVRSGVGTQVTVADINRDGKMDIAVGNKLGSFLFLQKPGVPGIAWEDQPLNAGSKLFYENVRTTEPLTAEQQQKTFVLPQGFEIQLVASEPDINKPMNLAFDAKGRLWVSSSVEYPFGAKKGSKPRDSIKILEDTDQDGRADKVTTFVDGLNIPMGLVPYGDGVICFSIPNIWYLRDTNGDGKVDQREVLYGPFDTSRDTHGMCSSFTLGNDGWIYACHGFNNQSSVKGRDGHQVTMHSGNTFRFRPDGSRIEVVGRGQVNPFGMSIDAFGDIFTADCHTKPLNLVLPGGHHDSFGKPHDGLGYVPNVLEHLHDSTGIGGVALGENTSFPQVYQRSTFGGNVVTGRVNRNHLVYRGSSMDAREESDFVIPGDPWFRPVNLQIGPDGALYIADFYNRIIGHYEVDLNHPGRDRERGRIWRVVYTGDPGRRDTPLQQPVTKLAGKQSSAPSVKGTIESLLTQLRTANQAGSLAIVQQLLATTKGKSKQLNQLTEFILDPSKVQDSNVAYWAVVALHQANSLSGETLTQLTKSPHERVRCLVQQLLPELSNKAINSQTRRDILKRGLEDGSPLVQRFAAISISKNSSIDLSKDLIALLTTASRAGDRYLVHATKIALRNQIQFAKERFGNLVSMASPGIRGALADVCMAIQSPETAGFIVDNLESLAAQQPNRLTEYLEYAAKHAEEQSFETIVSIARKSFSGNQSFQLAILDSLRNGLQKKQRDIPLSVKKLAAEIARFNLQLPSRHWRLVNSEPSSPFAPRIFDLDDGKKTFLIDSLSRGEKRTGTLRSKEIRLKTSFDFWMAGHDGPRGEQPKRSFLRIVLAESNAPVATVFVPSSDNPVRNSIPLAKHEGQKAFVEIVDGSDRPAFAWIAAGQFEHHPELNASASWSVDPEVDSLAWTCLPDQDALAPSGENIFVVTTRRNSSDGMQKTPLWSSIVKGEQRTGVFRSEPFELDDQFSFYLAGHDGFPDKPLGGLNYVQLKLAATGEIIQKSSPPRNDTAQPVRWATADWKGQKAYVEIVDNDTATAFAWLAAGRFSVEGLNPSSKNSSRRSATQIIARFQIRDLREDLFQLMETTRSLSTKSEACRALLRLEPAKARPLSIFEAATNLIESPKADSETTKQLILSIQNFEVPSAKKWIEEMMRKMTVGEQSGLAQTLAGDRNGADFLLSAIESGRMASSVLGKPGLADRIKAHRRTEIDSRLEKLMDAIPEVDEVVIRTMSERKKEFSSREIDTANGKKVFEKNCSNCHQLSGSGKQVGPNLDGIGNRGLERLVDDILVPNRNVDAAFRATLIATEDGRVLSGLLQKGKDSDSTLSLVNNEGKVTLIPKDQVENQKETTNSPMPANFGETISPKDFADLLGYLLSVKK